MEYGDLVSVIVVTYNVSSSVIATLESIKNQTYNNIELIISDDCSTDDTITKVKKWVDTHSQRFANVKIVIASQNKGTSRNCNQGWENAQGEYLKYIDADDLLLPNCIQDNVNFVINNLDIPIVFSNIEIRFDEICSKDSKKVNSWKAWAESFPKKFDLDVKSQFETLLRENFVPTSSSFIKKEILEKVGGFDEEIPLLQDWPLWTKITYNGIKLQYFEKKTATYNIHDSSVSHPSEGTMMNPKWFDSNYTYFIKFRAKHLPWSNYWDTLFYFSAIKLCIIFGNKKVLGVIFQVLINYSLRPCIHLLHALLRRICEK